MKIKINIQIFAIALILFLTKQIEVYAWLMLFALIHELAHMCAGLILKLKPKTLEIHAFGIGIIFESFENSEKNKIIIASAGPFINIIIAIMFYFVHIKVSTIIVNTNILLAIINLVPIYPLDGGRILKSVISLKTENKIADEITYKVSNSLMVVLTMISSILILIYKNIGLFFIVIYLWLIVIKENKRFNLKKRIQNVLEKQKNAWLFFN